MKPPEQEITQKITQDITQKTTQEITQVIAIDWSGVEAKAAQRRGIQVAACEVASESVELTGGRLRCQVEAYLLGLVGKPVVAGLDFSFSYPAWFLQELGSGSAPALWELVTREGERWLREPHPHFWGRRKGSGPPLSHRAPGRLGYRACERAALGGKRLPASSFQIGGAGAVGTGTLRGMPMLARLRAAGWSVWPFDAPLLPMLVEIYPRVLTGPVVKSSAAARARYLRQARFHMLVDVLAPGVRAQAEASEDAFDALVSAFVMREHAASFSQLTQAQDEQTRLEGAIWTPPAL